MTNVSIAIVSSSISPSNSPVEPDQHTHAVIRRGVDSGFIQIVDQSSAKQMLKPDERLISQAWQANKPLHIPYMLTNNLNQFTQEIKQTRQLYDAVLNDLEIEDVLDADPYISRLGERFQMLSSRFDESDQQEIISIDFDVMEGDALLMEDIWMRVSWLSYYENDASFRFRFSFGMENFDDVSNDPERQLAAAELSQCIFPESAIITENVPLITLLQNTLNIPSFNFVERIIYFNAPNGGAQFHHDAEKGHLGVVYAQITGETLWLALSRADLMTEISRFILSDENIIVLRETLASLLPDALLFDRFILSLKDHKQLSEILNDPSNEAISTLLNESVEFFNQLVSEGYASHLVPGDIMLLPQESMDKCAWHSVFCLGDEPGEALSFAIKAS